MRFFENIKDIILCAIFSLKAYTLADLIRAKGVIFSLIGLAFWLILLILPITLFARPDFAPSTIAAYIFCGILVFNVYSIATWDWAWEMRLLINNNVLEYIIVSGRSPLVVYMGMIPVSLFWVSIITVIGYLVVSAFIAPPRLIVNDIGILMLSILIFLIVVFSYALLLAVVILISGTSGAIIEVFSWILPLATGGFTPLSYLPEPIRFIALLTPFSYPAEMIRYSLGVAETILPLHLTVSIGLCYSLSFFTFAVFMFKYGLNKVLKEGVKSLAVW